MSERLAPVQGYSAGIPWAMHLRAYNAYCEQFGRQQALIEGSCRGGFHINELDALIPGWRKELSELAALRKEVERLTAELDTARADLKAALEVLSGKAQEILDAVRAAADAKP